MRYMLVCFELVEVLGFEEAALLSQMASLMARWRLKTGRQWFGETYAELHKLMPWWSPKQLRRLIRRLEDEKLLESREILGHRKLYRLDFEALNARLRGVRVDPAEFYQRLGASRSAKEVLTP